MTIFAIDDEPPMLRLLHAAIAEAAPTARILDFAGGRDALSALQEQGLTPDAVFSDIRMPEMDGLALASELGRLASGTRLVFVTALPQYALEAYRLHVSGYILKPVTASRVREELDHLFPPAADKLRVQCFGHFEVFWHGEPVIFQRRQSKELLAFLIDRKGRACTSEEIAAALWENCGSPSASKQRVRNIISDLKKTLRSIGMEGLLIRERRQLAIRRDMLDCDYYRMLAGDPTASDAFGGEYMTEYSWAEPTAGRLLFQSRSSLGQ